MVPIRINEVRENLEVLQDKDRQIRIWTGQSDYVWDYVETICGLFDDSGLNLAIEEGNASDFLGEELTQLLVKIGSLVDCIDPYSDPVEIANRPEMEEVRRLAQQALNNPIFTSQ